MTDLSTEFRTQIAHFLSLNLPKIENCLSRLTEAEVWQKPNANTNSIANLILHLCGNIRQYTVTSLGDEPDTRERDLEFSTSGGLSKQELYSRLKAIVDEAITTIYSVSDQELMRQRTVQDFDYTGVGILIHIAEHFSYHTGQIALYTKLLKDEDLGFYAGHDLNRKND